MGVERVCRLMVHKDEEDSQNPHDIKVYRSLFHAAKVQRIFEPTKQIAPVTSLFCHYNLVIPKNIVNFESCLQIKLITNLFFNQ